jgi:hypothetical protein
MPERDTLPMADELAASLRRVVNGRKAETLYDAHGAPVATLVPVTDMSTPSAREQFLHLLRSWREGDPEQQRLEWEQLEKVLAEERLAEPSA